jgi:hypothetical protein
VKKFHHYLGYKKFYLVTDHAALKWLQSAAVKGRLLRWVLKLQPYVYEVIHKPGRKHNNADALSRVFHAQVEIEDDISSEILIKSTPNQSHSKFHCEISSFFH